MMIHGKCVKSTILYIIGQARIIVVKKFSIYMEILLKVFIKSILKPLIRYE
jgi:hypothetical protein